MGCGCSSDTVEGSSGCPERKPWPNTPCTDIEFAVSDASVRETAMAKSCIAMAAAAGLSKRGELKNC